MQEKEGRVVKILSNRYTINSNGKEIVAHARGKIRQDKEIYVGDFVRFLELKPISVITSISKRKNSLTRPYVANIDIALIVVAKEPQPDFLLVDKILINCYKEGITPIICFNKIDLQDSQSQTGILAEYKNIVDCITTSARDGIGLDRLAEFARGQLVCLAGQSAVGKTSLLNSLLDLEVKTDGLSKKIKRGKNTTRHVEIYQLNGMSIVDTCGFSSLSLLDIKSTDLKLYYSEFINHHTRCKYTSCNHIVEDGCAIIDAVRAGDIDKNRYQRYTEIYQELKKQESQSYE